jgi:DNA polymerase (family 10)
MPSNYTIAKTLQRVAYYKEICGHSPGQYPGSAMEAQSIQGQRLDQLENPTSEKLKEFLDEADPEVIQTVQEILEGREISALKEDSVPVTILEITEIKGFGPKMARRVYDELGVVGLSDLNDAVEKGTLSKVKGFGEKMIEKIKEHIVKAEKKTKT